MATFLPQKKPITSMLNPIVEPLILLFIAAIPHWNFVIHGPDCW